MAAIVYSKLKQPYHSLYVHCLSNGHTVAQPPIYLITQIVPRIIHTPQPANQLTMYYNLLCQLGMDRQTALIQRDMQHTPRCIYKP